MLSHPTSTTRPLRVGVLLDGLVQPAWIDAALSEIRADDRLDLALIVLDATASAESARSSKNRSIIKKIGNWGANWRQAPYWAYIKLDSRLWQSPDDPSRLIDLSEKLSEIPIINVHTVRKKFSDWFPDDVVEAILDHQLDVVQRFGFRILKGRSLEIAQHGVWSFHHGDYLAYRGGPAGFWEVLDGTERTGMLLQRLTEDLDDGVPIARIFSRTDLRSVVLNRRRYYPLGPKLLARELVRLHKEGPRAPSRDWSCYSAPLFVDPGPRAVIALGARILKRNMMSAIHRFSTVSQAGLACAFRSDAGGVPHGAVYRARHFAPPSGTHWLDPCAGGCNTHRFIMLSEKRGNDPARIVLMPVDEKSIGMPGLPIYAESGGDVRSPAPFTWNGVPYMYVTFNEEPGLRLLRCVRWPDYWELADTILAHILARSVAVAEIDRRWWLFIGAALAPGRSPDLLYLFHASTPFGPWTSHAQNPVRLGDDGVCTAGPPFSFAGSWYRPARDLTAARGCSVAMMRIHELDDQKFSESVVGLIKPDSRLKLSDVTAVSAIHGLTVWGTARAAWRRPWGVQPPQVEF